LFIATACSTESESTPVPTLPSPTGAAISPTPTLVPPTTTAPPSSTPESDAVEYELPQETVAWLEQMAEEGNFTGSILVAHKDRVLLSDGYSLADRDRGIPNTVQTRYRIGSITKQFTAMGILILETRGNLSVTDSICTYIENCPSTWEEITIHHLLTHTSGLPEAMSPYEYMQVMATPMPPVETIDLLRDLPLDFPPGEGWAYSNNGYIFLGHIIEQASGRPYAEFMHQAIFTPLELNDTGYEQHAENMAIGYKNNYSHTQADFIDLSIPQADGTLYSTVEDLYHWSQALDTEQLLSQANLNEMFAPHASMPNGEMYGYGWMILQQDNRTIVYHPGGMPGFVTGIVRLPEEQITIIVLSNQEDQDTQVFIDILLKKMLGD
jgi:CubicO group peptidase (beta-lactamase class C family)